ncbi:hypothetical protein PR048_028943 [Dryococelus australis]|uniref:Uncharacterized protein n=1 Tax=Dryococelus australis TaxID=614101 RepID=A0ABQ9GBZ7_9NEOP|nr:hypothetical protein PR048_028943 [Dryococelus australis]
MGAAYQNVQRVAGIPHDVFAHREDAREAPPPPSPGRQLGKMLIIAIQETIFSRAYSLVCSIPRWMIISIWLSVCAVYLVKIRNAERKKKQKETKMMDEEMA